MNIPRICSSRFATQRRTLFSLSDISKLAKSKTEADGDEQRFHARKILPYSSKQLYSLVSDVPSYSSFIPFCTSSSVLAKGTGKRRQAIQWKPDDQPFEVDAELRVGFGGLEERYTSRVVGRPFESVTATASEHPLFNSLVSTWSFAPAATSHTLSPRDATLLTIDLAFSFANPLHRIASQAVLPKVADKMVEAFEKRCLEVYGKQ